jgi:hypothetical protein
VECGAILKSATIAVVAAWAIGTWRAAGVI